MRRAFELSQETSRVRDRYGRHKYGQSLLLSRRLIEAGVRLVLNQVYFPARFQRLRKKTRIPSAFAGFHGCYGT
ncbi:MAG TPA: DUF1501 domain-containing protein [Verrucomicrobiae bacterium]